MSRWFSKIHLELPRAGGWPFIKDPIHGEITFEGSSFWLYSLLNTVEFQRLGEISQLGFLKENFPGATHTRLSHSLGVYALTSKFINHFLSLGDLSANEDQLEIDLCLCSALLHDIGHGPFSHFFEQFLPDFSHEQMTKQLILNQNSKLYKLLVERSKVYGKEDSFFPEEIVKILSKESGREWIEELISSKIDVDRLDYLLRDKYFCGSFTLSIDPNLIIKWTRLMKLNGKRKLCFLEKTNYQRCSLLLSRDYMHKEIYGNLSAFSYQVMILAILREWKKIFKSNKFNRNSFYDLVFPLFFEEPQKWKISEFLKLNDCSLLSRVNELFLDLEKDSSGSKTLYSLLLLFKGYPEESQHILLRMKTEELVNFQKFANNSSELEKDIVLITEIFSLISESDEISRTQTLDYLDWESKEFKQVELILPETKKETTRFVLITKNLQNQWIEFKVRNEQTLS
ncbi:deoxyguanosinetriphosphate triphosphohydrolase [Mycoplasma ovis str. Michigan]|uniref:Deoxyguanosinetriphosphate triphosphohydrolase n=1 Tax=Mycoplasma ovis str. Michigan TaxID=1415773 RepID=A0ABM5P0D1_9MOLU|nr:HD domain-containing protein [Mycoplasma ovis]AHC39852.1 deoxyguanosinetriphosphate triphosphohydrolase [Mycoplasma ovis str. Michigan]